MHLAATSLPTLMSVCTDFDERGVLHRYVDGEIDEVQGAAVTVHLRVCRGCAGEVRSYLAVRRVLRRQYVADPEVVARLHMFAALLTRSCR
jgi:anti-sigma factor RsiW